MPVAVRMVTVVGRVLWSALSALSLFILLDVDAAAASQRGRAEVGGPGARGQAIRYGINDVVVVLVGGALVEAAGCDAAARPERRLERYLVLARTPRVFSLVDDGLERQLAALRRYFQRFRANAVVVWVSPDDIQSREAAARAHTRLDQMAALTRAYSAAFLTMIVTPSAGPCVGTSAAPVPMPVLLDAVNAGFETHAFAVPPRRPPSLDRGLDEAGIDAVMKELALTLIPRFSVGPTRPLK